MEISTVFAGLEESYEEMMRLPKAICRIQVPHNTLSSQEPGTLSWDNQFRVVTTKPLKKMAKTILKKNWNWRIKALETSGLSTEALESSGNSNGATRSRNTDQWEGKNEGSQIIASVVYILLGKNIVGKDITTGGCRLVMAAELKWSAQPAVTVD